MAAALRVVATIPARTKLYLFGLQLDVPGLAVVIVSLKDFPPNC